MPLDPSIFMNYASLRQRQNEGLQNTIANATNQYVASKQKDGFDLKKLAETAVLKSEMGVKPSADEEAAFNAYQKFQSAELGFDAYSGQPYQKFQPFGLGGGSAPSGGIDFKTLARTPGFVPSNVQARVEAQPLPDSFIGGVNDVVGQAPAPAVPLSVADLQPTGDPNMDAYRAKMFEQNQGMVGDALPPVAPKMSGFDTELVAPADLKIDPALEGVSPRKATEAKIDFQKDVQVEKAKADIAKQTEKEKKRTTDLEVLPILYTMIEQNEGTPNMPYAGLAQPVTRFADPKKSESVDLLKQNQLNLAAPLAKALGVNPTDKDFQATLQRIFDINATKDSRDAQIRQLINQIETKQGVESKLAPKQNAPKLEGKKVRQKSTGLTGQIINGEFVPDAR